MSAIDASTDEDGLNESRIVAHWNGLAEAGRIDELLFDAADIFGLGHSDADYVNLIFHAAIKHAAGFVAYLNGHEVQRTGLGMNGAVSWNTTVPSHPESQGMGPGFLVSTAWLWAVAAFGAYAVGKKQLTIREILFFIAVEALALAFAHAWPPGWSRLQLPRRCFTFADLFAAVACLSLGFALTKLSKLNWCADNLQFFSEYQYANSWMGGFDFFVESSGRFSAALIVMLLIAVSGAWALFGSLIARNHLYRNRNRRGKDWRP
jgi:hypothetical protein